MGQARAGRQLRPRGSAPQSRSPRCRNPQRSAMVSGVETTRPPRAIQLVLQCGQLSPQLTWSSARFRSGVPSCSGSRSCSYSSTASRPPLPMYQEGACQVDTHSVALCSTFLAYSHRPRPLWQPCLVVKLEPLGHAPPRHTDADSHGNSRAREGSRISRPFLPCHDAG